ncbi:LacI family DNA-binding transcriptional regulator [Puniceicoccus vermicola]|uniref:LacI family DNA-binding transcriptional regulator n=1 Tax=Puniceicoccus vermicola TaxID=388746 RepID=A0A7X1B0R3_9BACT|nr:LacI family DNA-binding transcriptional regulator [Puniceicoccus vermicola]MBC2603452.1 LacI family DNA-binding transcriptional regulator [Puniceicoccus vermicola]
MAEKPPQKIESTADLARYLNMSQWSVSRAINGHKGVSEETRKRVLDAMVECDFQPNMHARSLRGQTSKLIGVCFWNFSMPIVNAKLTELQRVLRGYGFRYLFETTMGEEEREISVIRDFQRFGVDGIVNINSILKAPDLDELLSTVPSVLVEPVHRETGKTPKVSVDRSRAMREIIHHLYELLFPRKSGQFSAS